MWIENLPLGDFKYQSEFIHAISDFQKFSKLLPHLYENIFSSMTPKEIYEYLLAENLVKSTEPKDWTEASRRHGYIRYYGDQFDPLCGFYSLVKEQMLILIVHFHGRVGYDIVRYDISLENYQKACKEFTDWFNLNLANFYPSYRSQ